MADKSKKLDACDVQIMRWLHANGVSQNQISKRYGISKSHCSQIMTRRTWWSLPAIKEDQVPEEDRQWAADNKDFGADRVKLDPAKVRRIRQLHRNGLTLKSIGSKFGVTTSTIRKAVFGETWSNVE